MKKALLTFSLAAMLVMGFAVTAQAHTLSFKKANAVSTGVAKKDCNKDIYCQASGSYKSDCKRASTHRVRCYALTVGTRADGTNYGCQRPVLVKMRNNSFKLIYATGNKTCSTL